MVDSTIKGQKKVDDMYSVELEINIGGNSICLSIDGVPKPVHRVKASTSSNILYIELLDEGDRGFATCVIDLGHVSKKCLKCKSLLIPP